MIADPTLNLSLAGAFFLGIHLFISGTTLRDRIVASIGEGPYAGFFSLLSVAALTWLSMAYARASRETSTYLWTAPAWFLHVAMLIMLVAFLFAVLGLTAPNPTAAGQANRVDDPDIAKGIVRVTRHPFLWGALMWALTHIVLNGDLSSLIFFGTFAWLALLGPGSIDAKRARALGARWDGFAAKTSNVPFAAIAAGRNKLVLGEFGTVKIAAAVAIYLAVLFGHGWLFGKVVIPG